MGDIFRMKRGDAANRPDLLTGEMSLDLDTLDMWIGTLEGDKVFGRPLEYSNVMSYGAKGDGVKDDTQAFIDALSDSDVVFVPKEKTFLIGDVDVVGKIVTGYGTIKKKAASESALHIKGDNSKVIGLIFAAETTTGQPSTDIKLGEAAKNCVIKDCTFMSPIYSAISGAVDTLQGGTPYLVDVNGVQILDNVFKSGAGKYARPIYLHSVGNIVIANNNIKDCNFDAIRLRENDGHCIINSNLFENIGDSTWPDIQTRDAIDVFWSGTVMTISNNIVNTTAFAGFDVKGVQPTDGTKKMRRVIITGNHIEKTRYNGIYIRGGDNFDGTGTDAYIDSLIISDNTLESCCQQAESGHGIRVEGMTKFLNIHDNIILKTLGRAIFINNPDQTAQIMKNVKVSGNMCINNGLSTDQASDEGAINIQAVESCIIVDNICENDTDMDNAYQACGIFLNSVTGVFTPLKSVIIQGNICRNNTVAQIKIEANTNRNNSIAVFRDNIQEGVGAVDRPTWQNQRNEYWGVSIPSSGDGIFRQGDIIRNVAPTEQGVTPDKYIVTGWQRISADGSTHVLNTDWVELRTPTGN